MREIELLCYTDLVAVMGIDFCTANDVGTTNDGVTVGLGPPGLYYSRRNTGALLVSLTKQLTNAVKSCLIMPVCT